MGNSYFSRTKRKHGQHDVRDKTEAKKKKEKTKTWKFTYMKADLVKLRYP
jgi:hypothetical protein